MNENTTPDSEKMAASGSPCSGGYAEPERIRIGRYTGEHGGSFEVTGVQMPGYPGYDGGLPGVSIRWGRERGFVPARDEAHFWSTWPWSMYAPKPAGSA